MVKSIPRSKYPEDVYLNNHTSVWGSYFQGGRWGFACCHQLHKQAFCTGIVPVVAKPPVRVINEEEKKVKKTKSKSKSKSRSRSRSPDRGIKRKYNSIEGDNAKAVTEADLESYKRSRVHWDDPMSKPHGGNGDEIDI